MRKRRRITRARLQELLDYDSETGEFRWLKRMSKSIHTGDIAGTLNITGYWKITLEGRQYSAHQLAWLYMKGRWRSGLIDHRDGDRSNNSWNNLRRANASQNGANRGHQRNNRCGFKGVVQIEKGRWRAEIYKDGRAHRLGTFATPEGAHAAYVAAARKLFGEFARAE